jgi:hypothetical protein
MIKNRKNSPGELKEKPKWPGNFPVTGKRKVKSIPEFRKKVIQRVRSPNKIKNNTGYYPKYKPTMVNNCTVYLEWL